MAFVYKRLTFLGTSAQDGLVSEAIALSSSLDMINWTIPRTVNIQAKKSEVLIKTRNSSRNRLVDVGSVDG